jgi:hypothetical protein
MRAFIEANFKMMDINSDGVIGMEEFRYNCIQRLAIDEIKVVDDAFNSLLNVSLPPSSPQSSSSRVTISSPRQSMNWKSSSS